MSLLLCSFEETGGIVAAHTTSIPEAPGSVPELGPPLLLAARRVFRRRGVEPRYTDDDGFGAPETAFLVCNFWFIAALAAIGRRDEARALFIDLLAHRDAFGLLSEDIHPETEALWGKIPQTYSMAGSINSAMRLSVRWEDVWCRVSS